MADTSGAHTERARVRKRNRRERRPSGVWGGASHPSKEMPEGDKGLNVYNKYLFELAPPPFREDGRRV